MKQVYAIELTTESEGIREFEYELFSDKEEAIKYFNKQLAEWAFSPADRIPDQDWSYSYGWDGQDTSAELFLVEKEVK